MAWIYYWVGSLSLLEMKLLPNYWEVSIIFMLRLELNDWKEVLDTRNDPVFCREDTTGYFSLAPELLPELVLESLCAWPEPLLLLFFLLLCMQFFKQYTISIIGSNNYYPAFISSYINIDIYIMLNCIAVQL